MQSLSSFEAGLFSQLCPPPWLRGRAAHLNPPSATSVWSSKAILPTGALASLPWQSPPTPLGWSPPPRPALLSVPSITLSTLWRAVMAFLVSLINGGACTHKKNAWIDGWVGLWMNNCAQRWQEGKMKDWDAGLMWYPVQSGKRVDSMSEAPKATQSFIWLAG